MLLMAMASIMNLHRISITLSSNSIAFLIHQIVVV